MMLSSDRLFHFLFLTQVIETQMRKKMEQVKELFSDLEDVYRHLVVAKGQVAAKMAECHSSLQGIQDSLDTLSAADGPKLLTQIQVSANTFPSGISYV